MLQISTRHLARKCITALTLVFKANTGNFIANGLTKTTTMTSASASVRIKQPTKPLENEYFSVAPMMAHTNRHYRYFFRQLSENAHLYTEMLPASQIVQLYEKVTSSNSNENDPHQIQERVQKLIEKQKHLSLENTLDIKSYNLLQELLDGNRQQKQPNNIALQLGGRDPDTLAYAAAIATAFGYKSINLNCGCPSSTVASGRQAGAALMREPELVATCLEQMSHTMNEINPKAILSVKHRLGTADASTYSIGQDSEELTYQSCHTFLRLVGLAGNVSKVHVHARLALLGLANGETIGQETECKRDDVPLWSCYDNKNGNKVEDRETNRIKVDHKRVQYIAKRQARQSTIQNRSIPPLRPTVVEQIANDFPNLEVVANGGVLSISQIQNRIFPNSQVAGVMVGRSAINHPCSFAGVDSILWNDNHSQKQTRKQVLQNYIQYCHTQEEQMAAVFPSLLEGQLKEFRKKLIAAPFHLFMGEDGNNAYQRRLRKLVSRGDRHSSHSMLKAAMAQVPDSTLDKQVDDHVPWNEIETFDFTKRSGTMQRTIH